MGYHMNDALFYQENLRAFVDEFTSVRASIQDALGSGDLDVASRIAHSLKSAAATIGAMELSAVSARLEQSLSEGQDATPTLSDCDEHLQRRVRRITPALDRLPAVH